MHSPRRSVVLGVFLLCSLFTIGWAPSASADTTYTYTGSPFNVFVGGYACNNGVGECSITGSFTVAQPLAANLSNFAFTPPLFSFTDGNTTWNPSNTNCGFGCANFSFSTDAQGKITGWQIGLYDIAPGLTLSTSTVRDSTNGGGNPPSFFAAVDNNPGSWSAPVPEPGSLLLLGTGLLSLVGTARRKWLR